LSEGDGWDGTRKDWAPAKIYYREKDTGEVLLRKISYLSPPSTYLVRDEGKRDEGEW